MSNFSFINDIKKVNWGDTLTYNFLRGSAAGLIVGLVVAINQPTLEHFPKLLALFMIAAPIALIVFFTPYCLLIRALDRIDGGGFMFVLRIIGIAMSLFPAIGDPLVKVLLLRFPKLVPIEKPGWFQTQVIILVLR